MKRNSESLLDPRSHGERQAGGQSSVVDLTVGGRACSTMRHLTRSFVYSPVARVGLVVRGGARVVNSRGPRREVGVALPFFVEAQQRCVRRLDDPLLNPHDSKNSFVTAPCNHSRTSAQPQKTRPNPLRTLDTPLYRTLETPLYRSPR